MQVRIELTNACLRECSHCSFSRKFSKLTSFLSGADLFDALDRILENEKASDPLQVILTGGEPLLHPEILHFIDLLNVRRIGHVALATDGLILSENQSLFEGLISARIDELILSMDWNEKRYSEIRGVNGLSQIEKIATQFHERTPETLLTANFLIHQENYNELDMASAYIETLPFNCARLLMFNQQESASNVLKECTSEQEEIVTKYITEQNERVAKLQKRVPFFLVKYKTKNPAIKNIDCFGRIS